MADAATFQTMSSTGPAPSREARARAFADAHRHSRRVRFLRKAIPVVIVGWVFLAFFGRLLNPFRPGAMPEVSVSSVGIEGSKLTMEQPKLSGFKKDNKTYEMVAVTATQDVKNPTKVELKKPVARIEMQKGSFVRLSAGVGYYDSTTEKLIVQQGVTVNADNGLDMRMQEANVDFKSGTVESLKPVEVDMPDGWVKSETMRVTDNGKTIIFEGNVHSQFKAIQPKFEATPGQDAPAAAEATPPSPVEEKPAQ